MRSAPFVDVDWPRVREVDSLSTPMVDTDFEARGRRGWARGWSYGALIALALLALSLLPWISPRPGPERVPGSLALLVAALGFAWRARPRTRRPEPIRQALGTRASSGDVKSICLTSSRGEFQGRGGTSYAAELVLAKDERLVFIEAVEPGNVLAVAVAWARDFGVPIEAGWGLGQTEIDALVGERKVRFPAGTKLSGPSNNGARGAALSLVCAALALSVLVGSVALLRDAEVTTISWGLLAFGVTSLLLLASMTATDRARIVGGSPTVIERSILGVVFRRVELAPESLRWARAVSPRGHGGKHLLLATTDGFLAFRTEESLAQRIEASVVRAPG